MLRRFLLTISESLFGKRLATDVDIRELLRIGMKDADVFVRSEAVGLMANIFLLSSMPAVPPEMSSAVAESTPPEALPLLVKQLKHPSHVVRMAVGQVIAAYRDAARQYLPQLEAAVAVETDDITRKTIAGTISIVEASIAEK